MMITVRIVISQTKKTIPMNWAQMSPLARTGPTSRLKQRRMTEIDLMMRMTGAVAENLAAVSTNPQVGISTVAAARVLRKATNLAIGLQKKRVSLMTVTVTALAPAITNHPRRAGDSD